MANTYIHSLPDSLQTLDPAAFTILDYKNVFDEYTTAKLTLSSLSDFVNNEYILTEEHLATKRATSWVNSNSSNIVAQTLHLNNSSNNNIYPIQIFDDRNDTSQILIQNVNDDIFSLIELNFQNSLSSSSFRIGTLGINYDQVSWTIGERKNDGYVSVLNKNLVIGSDGFEKDVIVYTGGPFVGNERIVAKGDGTGYVGINVRNPNTTLSINGPVSSNQLFFDAIGNSNQWNSVYSYTNSFSSRSFASTSLVEVISGNIMFKTGSVISGPIVTNNSLTGTFAVDELISRRYVDALVLQSNISGNFIPGLYYTRGETDELLISPYSVYGYVNSNSSLEVDSRLFVNNNSAIFLSLNSTVHNTSGKWESVYSYVNQASSAEEDQTEVTNFVIGNSARLLEVNSYVNNTSASLNDLYTFTSTNSSLNLQVRTYVNANSSQINQNNTLISEKSSLWDASYNITQTYSGSNIDTTTIVNANSSTWTESYTMYSGNSGNYATYQYVNAGFLPLSGGNVTNRLFAGSFGVGNSVSITGTLGTLSRKIEIFDINGSSIGFIPVYGSID